MKNLIKHYYNNLLGYAFVSVGIGIIAGLIRMLLRSASYKEQPPFTLSEMLETMMWTNLILLTIVMFIIGINLMIEDKDTLKVIKKIKEELS